MFDLTQSPDQGATAYNRHITTTVMICVKCYFGYQCVITHGSYWCCARICTVGWDAKSEFSAGGVPSLLSQFTPNFLRSW